MYPLAVTSHLPLDFLIMLKVLTVLKKVSGSYSGSHSISILRAGKYVIKILNES